MPAALAAVAPLDSEEPGAQPRLPQDHLRPGGVPRHLKAVPQVTAPDLDERAVRQLAEMDVKAEAFERGAGQVWIQWNSGTGPLPATTGQFTMTLAPGWEAWNGAYTGTASAGQFLSTSTGSFAVYEGTTWITWNTAYQETEDQRLERLEAERARAEEWQREEAARLERKAAASARSEELLLSMLSDAQRATRAEHGWFEVRGSRGGRYRIRTRGQAGNVDLMPEAGEVRDASYCAHPRGVPDADAHLAQMLMLVTDEDRFIRTANVHHRRPGWVPRALEPVAEAA